jgi:hypothetical protein
MNFIAVQSGARRGYAVPLILEKAGMLERLYTDIAGNVGAGRWLTTLRGLPGIGPSCGRLANRRVPREIVPKTRTFGGNALGTMWRDTLGSKDPASQFRRHIESGERWGQAMIQAGYGKATHVFTMLGEGGPFVSEAYRRGLTVVAEVYILLATEKILAEERRAFPDWETETPDYAQLRCRYATEDVLLNRTHFYLCPSEAVQNDLVDNCGVTRERTTLVPFGMDPKWIE